MSNGFHFIGDSSPGKRLECTAFPKILGAICLLFLMTLAGCSRNYSRFMRLPADPTLESSIGWVAVSSAYASLREKPERNSAELSVLRGGTVFKPRARIIDTESGGDGGFWYEYREGQAGGWIHSNDAVLFASAEQARQYAFGSQNQ